MAEAGRVQGVDVFKGAKLQKLHAPSSRHEIWFPLFLLHRYDEIPNNWEPRKEGE